MLLPLYPGDCNLPKESSVSAEDRIELAEVKNVTTSKFVPTPVVKIGNELISNEPERNEIKPLSYRNPMEIFNLPWPSDKENNVDSDVESSRAFNTRIIAHSSTNDSNDNNTEIIREIVEPILKPHSAKIGRSHDPNREKSEISEPILGPTTVKSVTTTKKLTTNNIIKEPEYNFYDVQSESDWVPATSVRSEKWKRQDDSRVLPSADNNYRREPEETGLNAIVRTVQFLPQRIARMFEEAEKYARERILPLVSNYTPRFLTDLITPRERPKYIPVTYEETTKIETTTPTTTAASTTNCPYHSAVDAINFKADSDVNNNKTIDLKNRTRQSYIQKIPRPTEKVTLVFAVTSSTENIIDKEDGRSTKEEKSNVNERESTIKRAIPEIRIDLPVFEDKKILYIPVHEKLIKDNN